MDGKIVKFMPRRLQPGRDTTAISAGKVIQYVQPGASQMDFCLRQKVNRAPAMIRDSLIELLDKSDWLRSLLFLAICGPRGKSRPDIYRLAASLEPLHLAFQVH